MPARLEEAGPAPNGTRNEGSVLCLSGSATADAGLNVMLPPEAESRPRILLRRERGCQLDGGGRRIDGLLRRGITADRPARPRRAETPARRAEQGFGQMQVGRGSVGRLAGGDGD